MDTATWDALNQDTAPVLTQYIATAEDIAGPYAPVPKGWKAKAARTRLGYASWIEALGERVHASPALLREMNPRAGFRRAGESLTVPDVAAAPPWRAAKIVISSAERSLRAFDDEDRLIAFYPITAGSSHDPLPVAEWKIDGINRNPAYHYNSERFWDATESGEAVLPPGPNNPVGVVWMDLSKAHHGIHGTPEPSRISQTFSHGCIRMTNWDASELADMVEPGTPVLLRR